MAELVAVTNRKLCRENFSLRLEKLTAAKPDRLILREKDLPDAEYLSLAVYCLRLCRENGVRFVVNGRPQVARQLGVPELQVSFAALCAQPELAAEFELGVSVHKREEACLAQKLGAKSLLAGHIFETDCKRGLGGRGLLFLQELCAAVSIPVFAIGGITAERTPSVLRNGASGVCVMSEWMCCASPKERLAAFRQKTI